MVVCVREISAVQCTRRAARSILACAAHARARDHAEVRYRVTECGEIGLGVGREGEARRGRDEAEQNVEGSVARLGARIEALQARVRRSAVGNGAQVDKAR